MSARLLCAKYLKLLNVSSWWNGVHTPLFETCHSAPGSLLHHFVLTPQFSWAQDLIFLLNLKITQ
jgi:hypothetical protein